MITNESTYTISGGLNRLGQTVYRSAQGVFRAIQDVYRSAQRVLRFVLRYKLGIMLILSVLTFIASGDVLRMVDVTAAPIDLGILAVLPLSAITVISFLMLTEWLIAWQWPVLDSYQRNFLEKTFKHLLSWQKALIYFSFYLALLYSFISVTKAFL